MGEIFGTLPGWLTLGVLLAGFIVFMRGGGGVALGHLRDANAVLTQTIADQDEKLRAAEREISELRGRTDVSLAITTALTPIVDWSAAHEQRAQERHSAALGILQLIADRLGPDSEHERAL